MNSPIACYAPKIHATNSLDVFPVSSAKIGLPNIAPIKNHKALFNIQTLSNSFPEGLLVSFGAGFYPPIADNLKPA